MFYRQKINELCYMYRYVYGKMSRKLSVRRPSSSFSRIRLDRRLAPRFSSRLPGLPHRFCLYMYQSPVRNFRVIVSRPTSTIEIPRGDLRSITQSREAITQLLRATILPLPAHLNISCVLNYYRRISFIGSFVIIFCSRLHKP